MRPVLPQAQERRQRRNPQVHPYSTFQTAAAEPAGPYGAPHPIPPPPEGESNSVQPAPVLMS